jgi:hypothetical protein
VLRKPRSERQIKKLQTPLKWYLKRRSTKSWPENVRHCLRWPQTTEIYAGDPVNSVQLGNWGFNRFEATIRLQTIALPMQRLGKIQVSITQQFFPWI